MTRDGMLGVSLSRNVRFRLSLRDENNDRQTKSKLLAVASKVPENSVMKGTELDVTSLSPSWFSKPDRPMTFS